MRNNDYLCTTELKQCISEGRSIRYIKRTVPLIYIDAWGRGYKKIREGFEGAGLPMPKIESADGGVKVTFQRNNVNGGQNNASVLENVLEDVLEKLSERQIDIVKRLIETGQWNVLENVLETAATLATFFNVNERTIRRDLTTYIKRTVPLIWLLGRCTSSRM